MVSLMFRLQLPNHPPVGDWRRELCYEFQDIYSLMKSPVTPKTGVGAKLRGRPILFTRNTSKFVRLAMAATVTRSKLWMSCVAAHHAHSWVAKLTHAAAAPRTTLFYKFARLGINVSHTFGINVFHIRQTAKVGKLSR